MLLNSLDQSVTDPGYTMRSPPNISTPGCPDDTGDVIGADVDPELERQLAQAEGDELIEAVLLLRQDGHSSQWQEQLNTMLQLVREHEPAGTVESTLLPRLGVLIVRARPAIIRRLIAQPGVDIASANRETGAALLRSAPEAARAR